MRNQAGVKFENQAVIFRFRWDFWAAATSILSENNFDGDEHQAKRKPQAIQPGAITVMLVMAEEE